MDREPQHSMDTREFVALWNVAREEHLTQRLSVVVDGLARRGVWPPLSGEQVEVLAHALQLAADPSAGPAAALQYLDALRTPGGGSVPPE